MKLNTTILDENNRAAKLAPSWKPKQPPSLDHMYLEDSDKTMRTEPLMTRTGFWLWLARAQDCQDLESQTSARSNRGRHGVKSRTGTARQFAGRDVSSGSNPTASACLPGTRAANWRKRAVRLDLFARIRWANAGSDSERTTSTEPGAGAYQIRRLKRQPWAGWEYGILGRRRVEKTSGS